MADNALTPLPDPTTPVPGGQGAAVRSESGPKTPGLSGLSPPTIPVNAPEASTRTGLENSGPEPGYRFGDFEIISELGRGGMGIVYKARQLSLDRVVAVKMLLAEHFHNPVALTRFMGEARAAAALDHPDIVRVYQVGECTLGHFFAMEFIEGQTLERYIQKGPLPIAAGVALVMALARAVDYAHSKGVIHRDLKPSNIMLCPARRPVIMDFGIAKVAGKSGSVTEHGVVIGTPSYMAPEQASEGKVPVGPAADIYALGAILYAVLSGRPPYQEETALSTVLRLVSPEPPPALQTLRPEVPQELDDICMKALAKDPADRFPSAMALYESLRQFRTGESELKAEAPALLSSLPTVILVLKANGKKIRLGGPVTLIGRGSECDLILRSNDVSKRHCQILLEDDGQACVEDLESSNGTYVNGRMVKRARLQDGDRLDVAGHTFHVRFPHAKRKHRPST